MFDTLDHEDFKQIENSKFTVLDAAEETELELCEVSEKKATERQEMFSLVLKSPADRFLPQSIYRLRHTQYGDGELFIVPVGQNEDGFTYQAVFNRLVNDRK